LNKTSKPGDKLMAAVHTHSSNNTFMSVVEILTETTEYAISTASLVVQLYMYVSRLNLTEITEYSV